MEKNNQGLISILMPMKNAASTLSSTLNSILNQSYSNFELVIIDDHSEDSSNSLVSKYNDNRIKLICNHRTGIAAALNTGLAIASGMYIARMDADDICHPDRLLEQLKYLKSHPAVDVVSCLVEHRTKGVTSQKGYKNYVEWINSLLNPTDHYNYRFVDAIIAHPTLFCAKSVFDEHGKYSEDELPEDFELWLRWMQRGVKFAKVARVLYTWVDYPERASRTDSKYFEIAFSKVKSSYFKLWFSHKYRNKEIWIWGYGKDVFRKVTFLTDLGIEIAGYIDIKARNSTERMVLSYKSVQKTNDKFYLIYVSDRKGKDLIKEYLDTNGLVPSIHYYFMT